jgi:hypothetical protein
MPVRNSAWNKPLLAYDIPLDIGRTHLLEMGRLRLLLDDQQSVLEMFAAGSSLETCLRTIAGAVHRLEPRARPRDECLDGIEDLRSILHDKTGHWNRPRALDQRRYHREAGWIDPRAHQAGDRNRLHYRAVL